MKLFNSNIRTIFSKELKDILRDRRTLFVAIILPIIINPLLIIGLLLVFSSQTEKEMQKSFTATIIGEENAPELTKIIKEFNPNPFKTNKNTEKPDSDKINDGRIVKLVQIDGETKSDKIENAKKRLKSKDEKHIDIIVIFPEEFEEKLRNHETQLEPEIIFLGSSDRSTTARQHITRILRKYVKDYEPIIIKSKDIHVGSAAVKEVAKIIPYILILMILTAAFTPAIDIMAGEKERGTIETLLITPADRREIVLGKFYTVFTVAISATILNLASLGVTVSIAKNILQSSMKVAVAGVEKPGTNENLQSPGSENLENEKEENSKEPQTTAQTTPEKTQSQPPTAEEKAEIEKQKQLQQAMSGQLRFPTMPFILFPVLLLMMIPAAALFGAIALALSSFAKSYKEGQYYITPLMMVAIPLSMVSLLPGIKFNFWLGIMPITNLSIIFRDIMTNITVHGNEGLSSLNWGNVILVLVSTSVYAFLALKWAKDVFYREDVLFREAEEFNWKFWRTPGPPKDTPTVSTAILAFLTSLILFLFIGQLWQVNAIQEGFNAFIKAMIQSQVLLIALPAVIFMRMNKNKVSKVFPVKRIKLISLLGIFLIMPALSLLMVEFMQLLQLLGMEIPQDSGFMGEFLNQNIITALLIIAVLPGICEEILFRGFIFSGFINNSRGSKLTKAWKAIFWSSLFFAIMHFSPIKIPITFIGGVVLAFVFWRTRNLLVSMLAHMVYNASSLLLPAFIAQYTIIWDANTEHIPIWLALISFVLIIVGIVLFAKRRIPDDEEDLTVKIAEPSHKLDLLTKPESEEK